MQKLATLFEADKLLGSTYYHSIFNTTSTLVAITDGAHIYDANKPFKEFFHSIVGVDISKPEFCLATLFEKIDKYGYVYDGYENKKWIDLVLDDTKDYHRVGIFGGSTLYEFTLSLQASEILENAYVLTMNDITQIIAHKNSVEFDLKNAVQNSQEFESLWQQYNKAIDISNLVVRIDSEGFISYVNEQFCNVFGYARDTLLGNNIGLLRNKQKPVASYKTLLETLVHKNVYKGELDAIDKNKEVHYFNVSVVPILSLQNEVIEYLAILSEITEIKKAKIEATRALAMRNDFFNKVSHELRTPLNSILNFTDQVLEIYEEIFEDKEARELAHLYLQRAYKNSQMLLSLVNSLLDISKLNAGKERFFLGRYNLVTLVRETYENCSSLRDTRSNISYTLECDIEQAEVECDADKLKQILTNLLSNAIKFTPKGFVTIRLLEEQTCYRVEVEDSGVGISNEKLLTVFEPFEQARKDDIGTGLGLSIAREYAKAMGIAFDFRSQENKGSCCTLQIEKIKQSE